MEDRALLDLLAAYRERYPSEEIVCDRFIDFVKNHEDCFERSLELGHVTGSAWLVNQAGTHVLLTHHRKLGAWFQLGGHADGDSDVARVALKEAREESGVAGLDLEGDGIFDLDIHLIPARKAEPAHYHYDVRFVVRASGSEAYAVSEESLDLAWVEIGRIAEYTQEESMLRMSRKWISSSE